METDTNNSSAKNFKHDLDEEQKEIIDRFQSKFNDKASPLETGWLPSKAFFSWMAPLFRVGDLI